MFADLRWPGLARSDGRRAARVGDPLENIPARVDWPGSYFYAELMEDFPDAKVLLSARDGDAWAKSMRATIWQALYGDGPRWG